MELSFQCFGTEPCLSCKLCMNRERSRELLKRALESCGNNYLQEVPVELTSPAYDNIHSVFSQIKSSLGACSLQCEAYMNTADLDMDQLECNHYRRYHNTAPPTGRQNHASSRVSVNLTPQTVPARSQACVSDIDESQSITEPYHILGTHEHDSAISSSDYRAASSTAQPNIVVDTHIYPSQLYPASKAQAKLGHLAENGLYQFEAKGSLQISKTYNSKEEKSAFNPYRVHRATSFKTRLPSERQWQAVGGGALLSAQVAAQAGPARRAVAPTVDVRAGASRQPRRKCVEAAARTLRGGAPRADHVLVLRPGQSALLHMLH